MILSQTALQKIKDKRVRRSIGEALDVVDQVVNNYIRKNKPNGPLTTFKALKIIREETKMQDEEILVDEEALATPSQT